MRNKIYILFILFISLIFGCTKPYCKDGVAILKIIIEYYNHETQINIKENTVNFPSDLKRIINKKVDTYKKEVRDWTNIKEELLLKINIEEKVYRIKMDEKLEKVKILADFNFYWKYFTRRNDDEYYYQFSNIIFDGNYMNAIVHLQVDLHDFSGSSELFFLKKINDDWMIDDKIILMIK